MNQSNLLPWKILINNYQQALSWKDVAYYAKYWFWDKRVHHSKWKYVVVAYSGYIKRHYSRNLFSSKCH